MSNEKTVESLTYLGKTYKLPHSITMDLDELNSRSGDKNAGINMVLEVLLKSICEEVTE